MPCRTLTISNRRGLHARASAQFVQCAAAFAADIRVAKDGDMVAATSIMELMMLAAAQGAQITVHAEGDDAPAALAALAALVDGKFGEDDSA